MLSPSLPLPEVECATNYEGWAVSYSSVNIRFVFGDNSHCFRWKNSLEVNNGKNKRQYCRAKGRKVPTPNSREDHSVICFSN
jgi:hypothetical protein